MNTEIVTIAVLAKAKPGKEADLRRELLAMIEPSRKDAGCINYDLHESPSDPAAFFLHENWASQALLDQHLKTPHVQALFAKVPALVAEEPKITFWRKIA